MEFVDFVEDKYKKKVNKVGVNNPTKYHCTCPICGEYLGEFSKKAHKTILKHKCSAENLVEFEKYEQVKKENKRLKEQLKKHKKKLEMQRMIKENEEIKNILGEV